MHCTIAGCCHPLEPHKGWLWCPRCHWVYNLLSDKLALAELSGMTESDLWEGRHIHTGGRTHESSATVAE